MAVADFARARDSCTSDRERGNRTGPHLLVSAYLSMRQILTSFGSAINHYCIALVLGIVYIVLFGLARVFFIFRKLPHNAGWNESHKPDSYTSAY